MPNDPQAGQPGVPSQPEAGQPAVASINRVFEQPPDAVSFFAEYAQILGTGQEVTLQFYENIPGPPGPGGKVQVVRSRLRATVVVSLQHAANIGRLLVEHAGKGQTAQGDSSNDS